MQFYTGQTWDQLQNGADELAKQSAHKRPSDAERLDFIEKAARLEGGIRMAQQLVPEIRRRHHEGLERSFAHLLTALQRLEGVSGSVMPALGFNLTPKLVRGPWRQVGFLIRPSLLSQIALVLLCCPPLLLGQPDVAATHNIARTPSSGRDHEQT
jgi:hypothetical protein